MNTSPGKEAILAEITVVLSDFGGRDYLGEIGWETRFFGDLGLASIDAVVLGEMLEAHYGRSLQFAALMAELGTREDRDLSLGELATFLDQNW